MIEFISFQTIGEYLVSEIPLLPATVLELCQAAWQHHSMGRTYFPRDPTGASAKRSSKQVKIYTMFSYSCVVLELFCLLCLFTTIVVANEGLE